MNSFTPLLVVITGPTAVGKTDLCIRLAQEFSTEIISCDSRQFYQEMSIGTAKPTNKELSLVTHHFIGHLSIHDKYNVSEFEHDVIQKAESLFKTYPILFMTGGSGLYIDAVCHGIDDLPDTKPAIRKSLKAIYDKKGLEYIQQELQKCDPIYYTQVDLKNPGRILRALEVFKQSGKTYSSLRKQKQKLRDFSILKIVVNRERQELFSRINERVELMVRNGLEEEAKNLYPYRNLNALKTVGYREFFSCFDGDISRDQAIANIKTNSRRYAKRQLTWFRKDKDYHWFSPNELNKIKELIHSFNN